VSATTAVVVGSGPNGLAAAITLARHGVDVRVLEAAQTVGGGTRSAENTVPGLLHDECSAFHPMGVGSPFFRSLRLEEHGLAWLWPEIDLAHPLPGGQAAVMWRDVGRTVEALGVDGRAWGRLFARRASDFDALAEDILRPILHVPAHPMTLGRFGLRAMLPAVWNARRFRTDEAKALFGGIAAHAFTSLGAPMSSSAGLVLGAAGHAFGWPVAAGGSGSIADALVRELATHGGIVETGVEVTSLDEIGGADVVMLDVGPRAATRILGERLPGRVRRAYTRFEYGPAAFKVDFAVRGGIPWTDDRVGRAGTVHVGGTFEEIAAAEAAVAGGEMPSAPFVLVGQQHVADPTRSVGDVDPIWAYAHVPHGYRGDATEAIVSQIERFAPGFRERIVDVFVRDPAGLEAYDPNDVGGDISAGSNAGLRVAFRPRITARPYSTGVPGVYLCSASTPPGAGVHGMCGHNAAATALRDLARRCA
jgi:phytoene dehydrogenase-like protein